MSEYDELVKRLRAFFTETRIIEVGDVHAAADAIELLVKQLNETDKAARAFYEKADTITKEADQELEDLHDALKVVLARAEKAEAEVERLKGVLEEIKRLSRLEDSVRMSAINQLTDKALEAKP